VPADAFRERSIEVTATGEEAVVQKDARVIEEVVVRKQAEERTETVRDTVRKTEVEVENTPGAARPATPTETTTTTETTRKPR
jgi:stress response protein YsnF